MHAAETHFKGWAKPGPVPPGLSAGLTVAPDETLDAISGHFRLFQLPSSARLAAGPRRWDKLSGFDAHGHS
ncbi:MAG: hypothetical protein ABMA26_14435 [Limisphaerales bacterium]